MSLIASICGIKFAKTPLGACRGFSETSRAPSVGQKRREPSSKLCLHFGQYIFRDTAEDKYAERYAQSTRSFSVIVEICPRAFRFQDRASTPVRTHAATAAIFPSSNMLVRASRTAAQADGSRMRVPIVAPAAAHS